MKSLIKCSLALTAAALLASSVTYSQDRGNGRARPSPNAVVSQNIGTTVVSITYGRPGLKGRSVDSLVPDGKVWRTGANESTAITFSSDVKVGGESVAAGTYSLYSKPDGNDFYFIINAKLSWGTQYDASQDVKRFKVPLKKAGPTEWFTIGFDSLSNTGAHLNLSWGDWMAAVPITVDG
ncbi:MAG TPA: hypothetical protein DIV79_06590 [Opitutae bacterium]|nr:hypothetical protein [Opitutae bacterium]